MQEIGITPQCPNNTASQQTHRRSSVSDLLSEFAKQKVAIPSPPPPTPAYYARAITMQGGYKGEQTDQCLAKMQRCQCQNLIP